MSTITHDDKYIYLDGHRVAVFAIGRAPHSVIEGFRDIVDGKFVPAKECLHDDTIVCEHCGHKTPTL